MRKESSTNFINETTLQDFCNANRTLLLIQGRWKLSILFSLLEKDQRSYSDFKKLLPAVSDRVLSLQLKSLAYDGIVIKQNLDGKTWYALTQKGKELQPVLQAMAGFMAIQDKAERKILE
nr:helix-turn-helix domain-containing protein [uncultured Flavobacterium sp.]